MHAVRLPKLFLCSSFADVATAFPKPAGHRVAFIPTAATHSDYTGFVDAARKAWASLGCEVAELDIATAPEATIRSTLAWADMIYLTGGNTFFLLEQLRTRGVDSIIDARLAEGAIYVGESAGAIVACPDVTYAAEMDEVPAGYDLSQSRGLGLTDQYVVPHYGCDPFVESTHAITERYAHLPLIPLTNHQALAVHHYEHTIVEARTR